MTMHARVMKVEFGDAERGISFVRDQVVPSARHQPGIVTAYWLADRASGQGLAVNGYPEHLMKALPKAHTSRSAEAWPCRGQRRPTSRIQRTWSWIDSVGGRKVMPSSDWVRVLSGMGRWRVNQIPSALAGRRRPKPRRLRAARPCCIALAAPSGITTLRRCLPAAALAVLTMSASGM